jgi:hypothetical protein
LNTNVEKMKRYIESFATVLEVVELGTKRSYRYFRSFKVTVESYDSNNMLNPENWPSGVKVARWFQRNNGKDINKAKKSPVNQPVTNMERAISKKNKATNNVIPGNSTVVASITIQSTAGVSNTNNNTEVNTSNSESESGKEAVDLVLIESSTIDNIQISAGNLKNGQESGNRGGERTSRHGEGDSENSEEMDTQQVSDSG